MKKIGQICFYGGKDPRNSPSSLTIKQLVSGSIFSDKVITQLKIQSQPGTRFFINDNINYIEIGPSGLYHIELDGSVKITSLRFLSESISKIIENEDSVLYIDYIYEV